MIKNGRPYSDENGSVDDALITDHTKEEIDKTVEILEGLLIG